MSYFSSIKRQLEDQKHTTLFQEEPQWYRRCTRKLKRQYILHSIRTKKRLKSHAPSMTLSDLVAIAKILFVQNDRKALMDRTLLNQQWLSIGRSFDIGSITYDNLHWQDGYILVDLPR